MTTHADCLRACKPYLYYPDTNEEGEIRICYALAMAANKGDVPADAAKLTSLLITERVEKLSKNEYVVYLRSAAVAAGLLSPLVRPTDPEYIVFRDKWLDALIEETQNWTIQGV